MSLRRSDSGEIKRTSVCGQSLNSPWQGHLSPSLVNNPKRHMRRSEAICSSLSTILNHAHRVPVEHAAVQVARAHDRQMDEVAFIVRAMALRGLSGAHAGCRRHAGYPKRGSARRSGRCELPRALLGNSPCGRSWQFLGTCLGQARRVRLGAPVGFVAHCCQPRPAADDCPPGNVPFGSGIPRRLVQSTGPHDGSLRRS